MNHIDKNPGLITKKEREQSINDIIGYFHSEKKETIGIIAAEDILDFFLQNIGKYVYNTGLERARAETQKLVEELDFKMADLRQ
jgi:uncharacterized protein (DUF2164 family)